MSLPKSDGFESNDFTGWTTETSPPATVQSVTKNTGTYAMSVAPGAAAEYVQWTITGVRTVYARCYVRFDYVPGNAKIFTGLIYLANAAGSYLSQVYMNNVGGSSPKWGVRYETGGTTDLLYSTLSPPAANTWYCLELMSTCSTADGNLDGSFKLYVNGSELTDISQTGIDTDYTTIDRVRFSFYENSTDTVTFYLDDCVASDSYIGPLASTPTAVKRMNLLNMSSLPTTRYRSSFKPKLVI